ncbi:hypothetical protein Tco_0989807 [Tanacetum coccineum]|uniref:Uncharacterized protein n=1 Tax=Tanacetum coccineum TaxID=301880 RepID=A0ABQ5EVG2_9ASTR
MSCYLPYIVEKIQAYVQKQCDEYDTARQETIFSVTTLFEQAKEANEDMRKQYAECKDISPERRVVLQKVLDDEAGKDYQIKQTLLGCVQEIQETHKII